MLTLPLKKVTVTVTRYFSEMINEYAFRNGATRYPLLADFLDNSFTRSLGENYASSELKKKIFWGRPRIT